jgi:uncharacterized protein YuzE
MKPIENISMELRIETDKATGRLLAVYFSIRTGKAAETREFANGNAFADYDSQGRLLGIELLGACEVNVLDKISRKEPAPVKQFIRTSVPAGMLTAQVA